MVNRYRASRFGLDAEIIDASNGVHKVLRNDIIHTCFQIEKYAIKNDSVECLSRIRKLALDNINDANLLRKSFLKNGAIEDVVTFQLESWAKKNHDCKRS